MARLWTSGELRAVPALVSFLKTFGLEAYDWDPETIRDELALTFGPVPLETYARLIALIKISHDDEFYRSPFVFSQLCSALAGDPLDGFEPATVEELVEGLTEVAVLDAPDNEQPFSAEVKGLIRAALQEEGFARPPRILKPLVPDYRFEPGLLEASEMAPEVLAIRMARTEEMDQLSQRLVQQIREQLKKVLEA